MFLIYILCLIIIYYKDGLIYDGIWTLNDDCSRMKERVYE